MALKTFPISNQTIMPSHTRGYPYVKPSKGREISVISNDSSTIPTQCSVIALSALSVKSSDPKTQAPSLKERVVPLGIPDQEMTSSEHLKLKLKQLEPYLPIVEVKQFNPEDKRFPKFLPLLLDGVFEEIGFSFVFLAEVKQLIQEKFGTDFDSLHPPKLIGSNMEKLEACHRLLDIILPQLQKIFDHNLSLVWKRIIAQYRLSLSPDLSPDEIRSEMKKMRIRNLNLSGVEIEILPPETLELGIQQLEIRNTKIVHIPGNVLHEIGEENIGFLSDELIRNTGFKKEKS